MARRDVSSASGRFSRVVDAAPHSSAKSRHPPNSILAISLPHPSVDSLEEGEIADSPGPATLDLESGVPTAAAMPTRLHDKHLTINQAQHAAALDDLLRQIVFGNGAPWDTLPKTTHKLSYKDRYVETMSQCGRKSKSVKVEKVQEFFQTNDMSKTSTAGMPHAVFKELMSVWKIRAAPATDKWNVVELHDADPSSSSGPSARSTRAMTICAVDVPPRETDGAMHGLNYVGIVLDPSCGLGDYHKAGIDPARMILMEKFGDWIMVLGPGFAMRPACNACWNVRVEYSPAPVFGTPALLRETIEDDEEMFVLSCVERYPCAHPDHEDNVERRGKRKIPPNSLLSIMPAPTTQAVLPTVTKSLPPSRSVSMQQSVPPSAATDRYTSMPPPPPPPPPPVQHRIIIKLPAALRPPPSRTRKLDIKIHHQVIRARVLLAAKRMTARLQQEAHDINLQLQELQLELDKRALEVKLAQELQARSKQALGVANASVAAKQTMLDDMTGKVATAAEAVQSAGDKLREAETARDEGRIKLNAETKRSRGYVLQLKELEKEVAALKAVDHVSRISSLEQEVTSLKAALAIAGQEADRKSVNGMTVVEQAAQQEKTAKLEKEVTSLKKALVATREEASRTAIKLTAMEEQAARPKKQELGAVEKMFKDVNTRLTTDLTRMTAQANQYQRECQHTSKERDLLRSDLGRAVRDAEGVRVEMGRMKAHYDDELAKQHAYAVNATTNFNADIQRVKEHLQAQWAHGNPEIAKELEDSRATIAKLQQELEDADRVAGRTQRELAALQMAQRPGLGAGVTRASDPAIPRRLQINGAGPSRHSAEPRARATPYSRSSLPLATPPGTASPTGSHHGQSPSPAFPNYATVPIPQVPTIPPGPAWDAPPPPG